MRRQFTMVLKAIGEGSNTTRDVADLTGQDINTISSVVSKMIAAGMLKRTGASVSNLNADKLGRRYQVFEMIGRGAKAR